MSDTPSMGDLLGADAPSNWGRWGPADELGSLDYLDAGEVLRGVQQVHRGEVSTLQIQMGCTASPGDPLWPGRESIKRQNVMDESTRDGDTAPRFPGFMKYWYELNDKEQFYDGFNEPGLTYSRELVEWFKGREIPNLVTDTIANEVTYEPGSGVALTEIAWLDDLADACAADGRWSFFYVAAPLKIVNGTGAPVNPVAIR
jgi:hypothetical protein